MNSILIDVVIHAAVVVSQTPKCVNARMRDNARMYKVLPQMFRVPGDSKLARFFSLSQ